MFTNAEDEAKRLKDDFVSDRDGHQPIVEDTISILRGLKDHYELDHEVRIKGAALVSAAILSDRYSSDFL